MATYKWKLYTLNFDNVPVYKLPGSITSFQDLNRGFIAVSNYTRGVGTISTDSSGVYVCFFKADGSKAQYIPTTSNQLSIQEYPYLILNTYSAYSNPDIAISANIGGTQLVTPVDKSATGYWDITRTTNNTESVAHAISSTGSTLPLEWWYARQTASDGVEGVTKGTFVKNITSSTINRYPHNGVNYSYHDYWYEYIGEEVKYTVTTSANPSNGGTVSGAGTYASGDQVVFKATPNEGWSFKSWLFKWANGGSNGSTENPYTYTMTEGEARTAEAIAYFEQDLKAYISPSGTSRKVTSIYVGVNGSSRKVVKGYVGVDGKSRRFL